MLTLNGQRSIVNFKVGPKEKIPLGIYQLQVWIQEMRPLSWKTAEWGGPPTDFLIDQKRLILTPKGPPGPPKHPKRTPNDVISIQGSCPKYPREFWKFHFGAVGFRDVRPRKAPGWFHTGAKAFFGVKIFKISKLSGMIDMMSPKKKLNGEGGLLCLWASPGPLESAISVNFSYTDLCWLWPLRGRKGKCQVGQRQSNREMVHGFMALSQKDSLQMSKTAEICSTSENVFDLLKTAIYRLWPLRGRKGKCQLGQRNSNPEILYG